MKNEIGRKLTSLTLMTIMFAGGLTLAIPGFLPMAEILPEAYADQSTTNGSVTVSSTAIQGAQVLQVTIADPGTSDPTVSHSAVTSDFNDNTLHFTQVSDGTWVAYVVDQSMALDAEANVAASIQFGTSCTTTLTSGSSPSFTNGGNNTWASDSDCTAPGSDQGGTTTMNAVGDAPKMMLAGTASTAGPSLNGQTGLDLDSWPIVTGFEFNATNYITFGDDTVVVTFGPEEAGSAISGPTIVTQGQDVAVTIEDNGLNIDPTTAETWTFTTSTTARTTGDTGDIDSNLATLGFGDNGILGVTDSGSALTSGTTYVFVESGSNTGVFTTHDAVGSSTVDTKTNADVDDLVSLTYGGNTYSFIVATGDAAASFDAGAEWSPSEAASYSVTDADMNRNSSDTETLYISSDNIIPTITIGAPKFLDQGIMESVTNGESGASFASSNAYGTSVSLVDMADESRRIKVTLTAGTDQTSSVLTLNTGWDASTWTDGEAEMLFYDVCSIADDLVTTAIAVQIDDVAVTEPGGNSCSGEVNVRTDTGANIADTTDASVNLEFTFTHPSKTGTAADYVIAADLHMYDQGSSANGIYRIEAVETGNNTGTFEGSVTYVQMNTVSGEATPGDFVEAEGSDIIIMLDNYLTGSSGPRVNFGDTDVLGSTNVTLGAQLDANTHSGVVSWDQTSYGVGDAATLTIVDADLNTDSTIIETYVGDGTYTAGTDMFSVQCDDAACTDTSDNSYVKIVEDGPDSDTFIAVFTVSNDIGKDLEAGYRDSRDGAGTAVIWYATATIGSTSGSISLDRAVYPVPFDESEMKSGDNADLANWDTATGTDDGDVTVWISVTDADYTDDQIKDTSNTLVTVNLISGTTTCAIRTAGADIATGKELGPLNETSQGSGVYEVSFTLDETDVGDSATGCTTDFQVLGGDTVLQVKYADQNGDTGLAANTFDSATFELSTGSLSTDKSVYVMGQDMVLTLTDADLNLDSDSAETYTLALIEWDSSADSSELLTGSDFTANPTALEETGDSTGVFQTVVTIPSSVTSTDLELGEGITLTYRDIGISGEQSTAPLKTSDTTSEDVETTIAISNFGASITLDKTVYDWTDTVNIEVVAPDHNKNSNAKESIGTTALPVKVSTRSGQMCSDTYTLKEDGEDSGTFVGYIVLQGLDGQAINGGTHSATATACNSGPEDGKLQTAGQDDGVTVTYEYDDGSVALATAIIQWNFSTIEWLDSSVTSSGSSIIRVVDPDEDLDDELIDSITVDVYSDSDSGGLTKVLNETDEATGIFEGTINFTTSGISSGNTLRVSEGDTVTAENTDKQLPGPDYTSADDLLFAATTTVGTAFPPLERAPASSARVVDASGSSVAEVSVDQQVQIAADVTNGQGKDQAFAYLVQVQDASGVTVSLSWLTGSLTAGQSMTAAQSWTPTSSGSYTATVFVWESVSNPTALSPTVSVNIDVV